MADRLSDPIGRLMGLRYKSHPWHGVFIGPEAPIDVVSFIEMVSTDTVKYEIDKESGYLKLDRPQKYSSLLPALYGFIPQTFCGKRVGDFCSKMINRKGIVGDGDPIDIVVLTEKTIAHGDILIEAKPIGGFRMIDGNEADDKIIAVMRNDVVYGNYDDVSELPEIVVKRLKHYFLTYKDLPGTATVAEIPDTYGAEEAHKVIRMAMDDYSDRFDNLGSLLYGK
ncbi:MAG: inorganic pyrophosphatase [Prolixibacteraceae bacterium]